MNESLKDVKALVTFFVFDLEKRDMPKSNLVHQKLMNSEKLQL